MLTLHGDVIHIDGEDCSEGSVLHHVRYIFLIVLCTIGIMTCKAQLLETNTKLAPDTLSLAERISLRTNTIDWLLLMPNISAEFDLGKTQHNHWAVGLGIRYNWQTKHEFKPAVVYNLAEVRAEVRYYWHTQQIDSTRLLYAHKKRDYLGRLLSVRRFFPKHLNTTYYRGAYVTADKYSFLLGGGKGYQGKAVTAGFVYGIVKPLYEFKGRNTLDLDLGISAGLCLTTYDEYCHDRESDCYPVLSYKNWHLLPFPVVSELRFAFVYRFGNYPLTRKYRWRIDVDDTYRSGKEEQAGEEAKRRTDEENTLKSINEVRNAFLQYYEKAYQQERQKVNTQQKGGADS